MQHSITYLRGEDLSAIETAWPQLDPRDTWEEPGDAERAAIVEEDAAEAAQLRAEEAAEVAAEALELAAQRPELVQIHTPGAGLATAVLEMVRRFGEAVSEDLLALHRGDDKSAARWGRARVRRTVAISRLVRALERQAYGSDQYDRPAPDVGEPVPADVDGHPLGRRRVR